MDGVVVELRMVIENVVDDVVECLCGFVRCGLLDDVQGNMMYVVLGVLMEYVVMERW